LRRSRLRSLQGKEKWTKEMLKGEPCLRKSKEFKLSKTKSRDKRKRRRSRKLESERRCYCNSKDNDSKTKRGLPSNKE
jgi:hypothetical protein